MCLAIPGRVLEIDGATAKVDFDGVRRDVVVGLCDGVEVGKYVIVHAGYAIEVMNEEDAMESLKVWKEVAEEIPFDKQDIL